MKDSLRKAGSIAGTGAVLRVPLGFVPKYVKVFNPNDAGSLFPSLEWWEGMAAASGLKTKSIVDSGSTGNKSSDYITSNGITEYAGEAPDTQLAGTVAMAAAGKTITGTSTAFLTDLKVGDEVKIGAQKFTIATVASATSATTNEAAEAAASGAIMTRCNGREAGFSIGVDTDINVSGETLSYLALA